ncbi:MAG TPA: LamG-like jellyroll fold domain-containing protein, partial [Candidatus Nanoarchaeia archaeon]|nr:LamG-like jellyroll fold domain-containing protein [Candidatus Nanoarchaeia archaeon]
VSFTDADNESVKVIYNWRVNDTAGPGRSITVLNMPFERVNGTNSSNAWDYSGYGNSGTIANEASNATWNATGGYDGKGAYMFNGSNQSILIADSSHLSPIKNFTFSAWVLRKSDNAKDSILDKYQAGAYEYVFAFDNNNLLYCFVTDNNEVIDAYRGRSAPDVNSGAWHHVACTYNGNTTNNAIKIYVNGTQTDSADFGGGTFVQMRDTAQPLSIGRSNAAFLGGSFNGSIDEVMIFNRSLSASQIWALFNNRTDLISLDETTTGQNWTVDAYPNDGNEDGNVTRSNQVIVISEAPDTTPPAVTWSTATQRNYTFTAYNVSFNATINEANIGTVYFSFDNASGASFNATPTNFSGTWQLLYNVSSLAEGSNTVTVFANDTSNNINMTEVITFITDFIAPTVSWVNNNNSNYSITSSNQSFNVTINELNYVKSVLLSFDNGSGTGFNATATNFSGRWQVLYNVSTLAEGANAVTVFANDSAGNLNQTEQRSFVVDFTAPTVSWSNNNNSNYSITSSNQSFNVTINELNYVNLVLLSFDNGSGTGFNATATNFSGRWQVLYNVSSLAEGANAVTVFANDSAGNLNQTQQLSFNADFTAPTATVAKPTNGTNFTLNIIDINFTVNDNLVPVSTCWYSIDNLVNTTIVNCQNISINVSGGSHYLRLYVNDTLNNVNATLGPVNFTINGGLLGNENDVTATGITSLNVSIGGRPNSEQAIGSQEVVFKDGATLLLNFTFNFSSSTLNLSKITLISDSTSLVINLSGQLQSNQTKVLSLTDNSFATLCVADREIASITAVSSGCDGPAETDFTSCIGVSTGTKIGNITCYDDGATLRFANLSNSGIRGTAASSKSSSSSASSGSGAGGGGKGLSATKNILGRLSTYTWVELLPNSLTQFAITDQELALTNIEFTVKEAAYGAKISVEKLGSIPLINQFPGTAYQQLEITNQNLDGFLAGSYRLDFIVPSIWLENNQLPKDNIKLYFYDGYRWEEQSTTLVETVGSYAQFTAKTPYFGYFVIGARDAAASIPEQLAAAAGSGSQFTTALVPLAPEEQQPLGLNKIILRGSILGLLLVSGIAALIINRINSRRKYSRRKKPFHKKGRWPLKKSVKHTAAKPIKHVAAKHPVKPSSSRPKKTKPWLMTIIIVLLAAILTRLYFMYRPLVDNFAGRIFVSLRYYFGLTVGAVLSQYRQLDLPISKYDLILLSIIVLLIILLFLLYKIVLHSSYRKPAVHRKHGAGKKHQS